MMQLVLHRWRLQLNNKNSDNLKLIGCINLHSFLFYRNCWTIENLYIQVTTFGKFRSIFKFTRPNQASVQLWPHCARVARSLRACRLRSYKGQICFIKTGKIYILLLKNFVHTYIVYSKMYFNKIFLIQFFGKACPSSILKLTNLTNIIKRPKGRPLLGRTGKENFTLHYLGHFQRFIFKLYSRLFLDFLDNLPLIKIVGRTHSGVTDVRIQKRAIG